LRCDNASRGDVSHSRGLLSELAQRKTAETQDTAKVAVVEDPVCHMQVRAEQSMPHTHYRGHDVYFCSELCKTAFEKEPARYLP
jgi:YHS domain-containing protein